MNVLGPWGLTEVGRAPDRPGLYVWYGKLVVGKADLTSAAAFISVLDAFSARFERQRISAHATLNFNLEWSGTLEPTAELADRTRVIEEGMEPGSLALAADLLESAQHLLSQPLYVGKAESSLRTRLRQHADEFLRLKEIQGSTAIESRGEDNFAQRAVKIGFSEDQLVCYALPVDSARSVPAGTVGAVVSLVESYLNMWATPLLGRK